jgi:hypothetical protein
MNCIQMFTLKINSHKVMFIEAFRKVAGSWIFSILYILYFSILLHSFNTEYLFFCPSM